MKAEALVYVLCFLTSALCAGLLVRSYRRRREPLLLGTSLAFVLLALNNAIVVVDMLVLKEVDLTPWRQAASLAAVCVLLYSFIWRADH